MFFHARKVRTLPASFFQLPRYTFFVRLSCFKYIRLCARPQPRAPRRSRATRARRSRRPGSHRAQPCAACGASAPSARLSLAACAPCAPGNAPQPCARPQPRAPCRSSATRARRSRRPGSHRAQPGRAGHAVRDLIERNRARLVGLSARRSVRRARPVSRPRRASVGWSRPVRRALLCRPWRVPRGAPFRHAVPMASRPSRQATRRRSRATVRAVRRSRRRPVHRQGA